MFLAQSGVGRLGRSHRCFPRLDVLESRVLPSLFTVDRLTDLGEGEGQSGDLRYCLTNAVSGDTVAFGVTGTINLTGALPDLTQSINIAGPGADLLTVRRDTGGGYRIFDVAVGAAVNIYGLTISNGFVSGLGKGAGISNQGTVTVAHTTITANSGNGSGGAGIYNQGTMMVVYSSISGNRTLSGDGSGIANAGTMTLASSTVSNNTAGLFNVSPGVLGGGIFNSGTLTVTNSTIADNKLTAQSQAQGGGICNMGRLTVTNSTVAGNTTFADFPAAQSQGGGIWSNSTIALHNTVVATNYSLPSFASGGPDFFGTLTSSGYNLIGDTTGGHGFDDTDLLNVNPLLGALSNNGGPTRTMALLPGSPAIDAGDNTDASRWDQRGPGFPRIVNGVIDIGAFEAQQEGDAGLHGRRSPSAIDPLCAAPIGSPLPAFCPTPVVPANHAREGSELQAVGAASTSRTSVAPATDRVAPAMAGLDTQQGAAADAFWLGDAELARATWRPWNAGDLI